MESICQDLQCIGSIIPAVESLLTLLNVDTEADFCAMDDSGVTHCSYIDSSLTQSLYYWYRTCFVVFIMNRGFACCERYDQFVFI